MKGSHKKQFWFMGYQYEIEYPKGAQSETPFTACANLGVWLTSQEKKYNSLRAVSIPITDKRLGVVSIKFRRLSNRRLPKHSK